jgi:hypothetical protein
MTAVTLAAAPQVRQSPRSSAAGHGRSAPLDGLRAVAALAVLTYHAHYGWAQGGFLGVDMFFVLSGYLITGGLLKLRPKGVACQREGTRVLPRPRDHLGRIVMVMSAPRLVNQDTPVAAGRGRCCRR